MKKTLFLFGFLFAVLALFCSCACEHAECTQATCEAPSACLSCGVVVKAALGHTEVVDTAVAPTCTETGLTEGKRCSTCGKTLVEQTTVAATGHTEVVDAAVAPTCTETGLTEGKHCSVCNEVLVAQEAVAAKNHTPVTDFAVEATCKDTGLTEGSHCSACGTTLVEQNELPRKEHTYDDRYDEECNVCGFKRDAECAHANTVVIPGKKPTCTATGLTEGSECQKCGEILVKQTVIAAKGHNAVVDAAVVPTCTIDGKTEGKHCSVCNAVLVKQTVIPAGHTDGEWVIDAEATCTEGGSKHQVCAVCNESIKTETIPATGHTEGEWVIDAEATCTEDGSKHQVCAVCDESIKTETIPATGHTDGEWVTDAEATCTEDGSKHQVCSVCNETIKTETVAAKGHQYNTVVIDKSSANHTCSSCFDEYTETIVPIDVNVALTGTGTSITNGGIRYSRSFRVTATGGYGAYQYKYEVYSYKGASTPALTEDFSGSKTFGYSAGINPDSTVLKVTVKDEAGNVTVYRVYGSGAYIDSYVE